MQGFQSILPMHSNEPLTVSQVTARVKELIEGDDELADVRVAGEISNLARPASGHLYFTLKDAGGQIKCAMWKGQALRMRYTPKNGDAVIARGRVGVYERDGAYQLYVDAMTPSGVGDLFAELERLKQKLADEGLFDEARKRPLPALPRTLGVVTSPSTAAFQDILNVLRRRYPLIEVLLSPTLVQGADAPPQIVRAIQQLNALYPSPQGEGRGGVDVILVARGGGSIEELWAFNDERVVRAVAASRIPVVTGVGHEIDFTLADFAADLRAPTPSAAAEVITPDINDLRMNVDGLSALLAQAMQSQLADARANLINMQRALRLLSPANQVAQSKLRVQEMGARLRSAALGSIGLAGAELRGLQGRLQAVSPLATLQRGYAIVQRKADGTVVRSVSDVTAGDELTIRVSDGEFEANTGGRKLTPTPE
jgi:exodeoxyribonuclease VII large subunit